MNIAKDLFKRYKEIKPNRDWLVSNRAQLQSYLSIHPIEKHWSFSLFIYLKPVGIAISTLLLFVVAGGALAANNSLPTDLLYPVKIASEQLALTFTPTASGKAKLRLNIAQTRLQEAEVLLGQKSDNKVVATINSYEEQVKKLHESIPGLEDTGSENGQMVKNIYKQIGDNQAHITEILKKKYDKAIHDGESVTPEVRNSVLSALDSTAEIGFQVIRPKENILDLEIPAIAEQIKSKQLITEQRISEIERQIIADGWSDEAEQAASKYLNQAKENIFAVEEKFANLTDDEARNYGSYRSNYNRLLQAYQLTLRAEDALLKERPSGNEKRNNNSEDRSQENRDVKDGNSQDD